MGTITGFGSVVVNGVRFDDRGAMVTIDDQPATSAQLRVGMVVAVEGRVNACPNADTAVCDGIATRIRFRNNLEGPITTLNRLSNTLQVMGRDIVVDDETAFDGGAVVDLGGFGVGDVVAVSGLSEQNRLRARLVQRIGPFVDGTTPIMVHGLVAHLDAALGTCAVDGVQVRFQGLGDANLPAGGLADGQYVQVQGRSYGSGLMTADRIQLRDRISTPDASLVELEGYVSAFVSVADFAVDGQRVDASSAIYRNGTAADLTDGARVEVEGTVVGAVLVARKLIFRLEASAQIVAPIQGKDVPAGSLVLLGQRVATTPLTQYTDHATGSGRPNRSIGYADLTLTDRVDVRAYQDGSGQLVATRVERTEADPLLIARGAVDAKAPLTSLTLLGIDVSTSAMTRYRDSLGLPISDVAFYALVQVPPALPTVVRAQGVAGATSASTIDATRATSTRGEVEIAR
ncbi:MAG TPA: DUF5666 domain-containing protein [Rubrivivax sp.]|nr:DUF5666 domain-containing protein [Rubrivivax sp.]